MKIAVEGCCHGELDNIYQTIEYLEKKNNVKVDLLLICGDFQSVRNTADMDCMAVPPKHRKMNSFYKYYSGEKVAPILTIFIGGNHEASNYLQELPYGGWVAPKIYYMGYAGVVQVGGVRIGGMSGIYKSKDYMKGHFEHPPYCEDSKRSAYHIRNFDVFRLKQVKQHIDIFLSHDWPRGIYKYGNVNKLVQKKKFFAEEIEKDILGNPVAADLLKLLQPTYWFSAHLHVKFPALVQHSEDKNSKITQFLALDKCLPRRQFLQVIDVPHDNSKPMKLQLDSEWLAILKSTNHMLSLSKAPHYPGGTPGGRTDFTPTKAEIEAVKAEFGDNLNFPERFDTSVPAYDPKLSKQQNKMPSAQTEINPQTTLICSMLDLTDPNAVFLGKDSKYNLPEDADVENVDGGDDNDDDDDDDNVDDDYDSELSFVSLSESEKSFSDRSCSLLSVGNDSILSAGNESFTSVGNAEEISITEEDDNVDNSNNSSEIRNLSSKIEEAPGKIFRIEKRLSLSEKLKMCPPTESGSSSDTAPSLNTSQDEVNDESEIAEILAAQKSDGLKTGAGMFSPGKSDSDSEIVDSQTSSSSLDCKSLEISDDDPELQQMIMAQSSTKKNESIIMEVSTEKDDVEFQAIIAEQKKNKTISDSLPELSHGAELERPLNQSSPIVNIENKCIEDSIEKSGQKRMDTAKTIKSPASKKFKRRNQDMYVKEDSIGEF
ncbi:lariat debranching enzyme A-like [Mercenaria mercenaria]|uniref:lariat debranching enzyme A-like n=1 Tax=Mercenaria mercenaria TaxID=6596 RepID=UPI00234E4E9A|nr:lariat debranching enzyme A-like [Mercenaria mercenaria]